jgi:two-component system KDP operon response regulator KdpE
LSNPRKKVLVVDDELGIRRLLQHSFDPAEFHVLEAENGTECLRLVATESPDVVLLDLGLPDLDGVDVTRRLREWTSVPVIVLSARDQERDKVAALDAGADDYLTKPFGVHELLARIRVALRHAQGPATETQISFGSISVDFAAHVVSRDGVEIHLTPNEFKLLACLARNVGKVVTHRQLLVQVWGVAYAEEAHYLRVYMGQLRHKLEDDPARPKMLVTDPGVGYRLKSES